MKTRTKRTIKVEEAGDGSHPDDTAATATIEEEEDVIKVTFGKGVVLPTPGDTETETETATEKEFDRNTVDNVWTAAGNALRNLLVFLIRKYRIDEVYDSRIKALNWDKLIQEFHEITENFVGMPKSQVVRKWHNWKQYNKQHQKPHPFVIVGDDHTEESVRKNVKNLLDLARNDPSLKRFLLKGGNEPISVSIEKSAKKVDAPDVVEGEEEDRDHVSKPKVNHLRRLRERDFKVRRTGVTASTLTIRRLEHEIILESLNFEHEKLKRKHKNYQLLQVKLEKEGELATVQLEKAKIDLALKQQQCRNLGVPVPE